VNNAVHSDISIHDNLLLSHRIFSIKNEAKPASIIEYHIQYSLMPIASYKISVWHTGHINMRPS